LRLRPLQFVCLVLLLGSLRGAQGSVLPVGEYGMDGRYLGTVLCQDCAGVWTEITLTDTGVDWGNGSGTFVMIERFAGGSHGGATVLTLGDWSAVEWAKGGNYTGTIELHPTAGQLRYLFCDHGRSLRILNPDRTPVSPLRQDTLQRVIPQSQPHFLLSAADSGTTLHARIGDTITLALPVASLASYRTAWTMKPPAAQCMTVYTITGSGNQGVFTSDFLLKAAAPGKVHIEFQSAEQPSRSVAYDFEVLP
jgi:NlpE N-terminal domain